MTPDDLRAHLNRLQARFEEKPIQHGVQLRSRRLAFQPLIVSEESRLGREMIDTAYHLLEPARIE